MHPDLIPADESLRVAALRRLDLVGTAPEAAYDRLVRLATTLLDVPIALISLVDGDRSWFKARVGLDLAETGREASFCAHTVLQPHGEAFVIEDTWLDERFESHPLVGGNPRIRFYAGQPLYSPDGYAIGTLAVIDRQPRTLSARELLALADLAALAEELMAAPEQPEVVPARPEVVVEQTDRATLQRLEALELMLEHTTDIVVVVDAAGRIDVASSSFTTTLGYTLADQSSEGALGLVHPDDRNVAREALKSAVAGTSDGAPFQLRVRTRAGSMRNMECTAVSRFDKSSVRGVVLTIRDVSERHMLHQMLNFQSTHDRLTELPNQTLMQEHLRPALARASRERSYIAVCIFDIDGFAELNQLLGHAAGDELLIDVAKRIGSTIRNGDSVARIGADEFAVLLDPVATPEEATMVAGRIVSAISGPHSLQAGVSNCGASAGVALSADHDDANTIITRASLALAAAKRRGVGRVELAPEVAREDDLVSSRPTEQQF